MSNSIASHYPEGFLNPEKQEAARQIEAFLEDGKHQLFVLKGYAGTGKTTLIPGIISYLKKQKRAYKLLATTGPAAKIARQKAAVPSSTIHSEIYTFDSEELDEEKENVNIKFRLGTFKEEPNAVFIIDEVSQLSDHKTTSNILSFGSGRVLTDLIAYAGRRQIICIGDPAQLPPVNTLISPIFSEDMMMQRHNMRFLSSTLKNIVRQDRTGGINHMLLSLRTGIQNRSESYVSVSIPPMTEDVSIFTDEEDMTEDYAAQIKATGIESSIYLCYTNKKCLEVNHKVRSILFPRKPFIQKGELLVVMRNNVKYGLANGEQLEVTEISKDAHTMGGLTFRELNLKTVDNKGARAIKALAIEEVLYNRVVGLTAEDEVGLRKNFFARTREAIKKAMVNFDDNADKYEISRKKYKQTIIENLLKNDPYMNALHLKFGYAITCHRAQGGEWDHVYVAMERALFNPAAQNARLNQRRWLYTAFSRAVKKLNIQNNRCIKQLE